MISQATESRPTEVWMPRDGVRLRVRARVRVRDGVRLRVRARVGVRVWARARARVRVRVRVSAVSEVERRRSAR